MSDLTTLGSLVSRGVIALGDGYRTKRNELSASGFRIIRVADVNEGRISLDSPDFVDFGFTRQIGEKTARPNDVILTTKGTVGRVAVVPAGVEGAVYSPQICWFRVLDADHLNPRFLSYWLRSPAFIQQSSYLQGNSDMAPYISLTDLRRTTISVPAIPEQQAIAEVLGALEDKIAANTLLAVKADELAGATYDECVRTWKRSSIGDVLSPVLGGTPSRANEDFWSPASDLWISARDVTSAPNRVVLDTVEKISPLATATTKAKPLPVGSVILTARGTVGAVARLARPAAFNQSCYGFAPTHVPAGVLFFSVLRAAEHARKIAHGSVFDTITKSTFDHLEMAWDSRGAPELDAQLSPLLRAIDGAIEQNRTLAATRDSLLPKLMSGQLRVLDAEKVAEQVDA